MDRLKEFALDVLALIIAIVLGGVSFFILGVIVYSIIMMIGEILVARALLSVVLLLVGMTIFIVVAMFSLSWATDFVGDRYYKWKIKRKKADK